MTLEEMQAMELNQIWATGLDAHLPHYIQRVQNGWNYIYPTGPVFVPEILPVIQHVEPRK